MEDLFWWLIKRSPVLYAMTAVMGLLLGYLFSILLLYRGMISRKEVEDIIHKHYLGTFAEQEYKPIKRRLDELERKCK